MAATSPIIIICNPMNGMAPRQISMVSNAIRSGAAQIEQCEAERWGQEAGLKVERHQDSEPDRIRAENDQRRGDNRYDNKDNLNEVEEEAEHEHDQHGD